MSAASIAPVVGNKAIRCKIWKLNSSQSKNTSKISPKRKQSFHHIRMEVDDAALATRDTPTNQASSPRWLAENCSGRTASHIGRQRNETKSLSSDKGESPPVHDTIDEPSDDKNDSLYSESALKLEVSGTDEEDSVDGSAAVTTNLAEKEIMKMNALNVSLKRKRYEIRRSGSDECLLGFDDQSGEARSIKADLTAFLNGSTDSADDPKKLYADTLPRPTKKSKQGSSLTSLKASSPKLHSDEEKKIKKEDTHSEPIAEHIVADNEDTEVIANLSATTNSTSSVGANKKHLAAQDDFYKKPFEYGWKRELVWRSNIETSKDKADVYFITPGGKKLRGRSDIAPLLEGDLTIDHFSFAREPLGLGPEFETVRTAKCKYTPITTTTTTTPTTIGKRVSKPKGPKGASPPPQGWTPTRALKVNNALLSSSAASSKYSATNSTPGTPPNSRQASSSGSTSQKSSKLKKGHPSSNQMITSAPVNPISGDLNTQSTLEPCTMKCSRAPGQIPQLKCVKCLCLYHHECVGLNRLNSDYRTDGDSPQNKGRDYTCEACLPASETSSGIKVVTPRKPSTGRAIRLENKYPQTIAVVKGKKYVMVAKPIVPLTEHVNDIENDLKQINESIRNNRKPSTLSLDSAISSQVIPSVQTVVDQSNRVFATNFFANVSFAYDALLCILKYLKIHERPRAASVCKLWHLAAKDTSLWQTVRMKNSRVNNWAGFAAALRRGETKHLDLRKMLVSSTRGEEMWQEFSDHIGTVCSLEIIDLCRCSARIVESLFQSNKNLRILSAVAINDDSINLENVGMLTKLEELRIRTCEPCVMTGNLQSLQALLQLNHLSLTAVRELGAKGIEVLAELVNLQSLELGECGDFDSTFAKAVLPKLKSLRRLRLENGQETSCCTLEILDAVVQLEELSQLELVNFDIKSGFDDKLQHCINIRKLLIIPTYISQSATTNHIVLNAVQQVANTLNVFTWGVTVELLRVTALYVDQCEESTKKEKHHFDECIPVLKPVPGAPPCDDDDDDDDDIEKGNAKDETVASDVPQIEILPLDKVESILGENLPKTKFTIVKVPYHATCKQQLVE